MSVVSHSGLNEGSSFGFTSEARLLRRWFVPVKSEKSLILDI